MISIREIGRITHAFRPVISNHPDLLKRCRLTYLQIKDLNDGTLSVLLFPEEKNIPERKGELEKLDNRPNQKLKIFRRQLFEETDKHTLSKLIDKKYLLRKIVTVTVKLNYQGILSEDKRFYSVPYCPNGYKINKI